MQLADGGLSFEVVHLDEMAVIRLSGELDLSSEPLLREVLEPLCGQRGFRVELDVAQVTFMDSSGLHALVDLGRLSQSAAGKLVVLNPNEWVRGLFETTGIDRALHCRESGCGGRERGET